MTKKTLELINLTKMCIRDRDLSWLNKEQIIIIIKNFSQFLQRDALSRKAIIEDFNELILPWWESEVIDCVAGGKTKKMFIYLIN